MVNHFCYTIHKYYCILQVHPPIRYNITNVSYNFFLIFILSTGLMLWQTLYVNGRPVSSAQLNKNRNGGGGYNYPVPDNPLEFPDRKATVNTEVWLDSNLQIGIPNYYKNYMLVCFITPIYIFIISNSSLSQYCIWHINETPRQLLWQPQS